MPHILHRAQRFPISVTEAWDFFATPQNLPRITPPWLGFELTSPLPDRMHAGMQVTYRVRPFCRIPVQWVTEIVEVEPPTRFVDVQRKGPYRLWRHTHAFREILGGVEMDDHVEYALPYGAASEPIHLYVVRPQIARIFEFRRRTLEGLFGKL